ncbi:hypothetical protein ACIRBX_12610 [Kitasatospora sp. NPDC096147]|uniref:hypothetical protein n=1 Tax=Kitasatospora sp. NPDC096147 TaxID=3364093 RepID=UPI00380094C2
MSRWPRRTAPGWGALLIVLLAALTGCGGAGQLHDAGPARPVAVPPKAEPLWAAVEASAAPTPEASSSRTPLAPVPGITVTDQDIRSVQAPAVLAKDTALRPEEAKMLTGCQDCAVRPAEYRDLDGDGRPELITALTARVGSSYLHVYALRDGRLYPVLAQQVERGFTAETVGSRLKVTEPNGGKDGTETTYTWDADRLVVENRKITGPGADDVRCEPTAGPSVKPQYSKPASPVEPKVSTAPTPVPERPQPKPAAPSAVPSEAVRPAPSASAKSASARSEPGRSEPARSGAAPSEPAA